MKKQTDFTFEEAKTMATHYLSVLGNFMESMNQEFKNKVPLDWAILVRELELKVSQASSPCLEKNEIRPILDFARQLIQANPDIRKQLTQFWNLYSEAYRILKSNPGIGGYAPQGIINANRTQIDKADLLAENLVSEVKKNPLTFASPVALLLAHVVRAETVEYSFWKQLNDVVDKFGKYGLGKYDIALICSVQSTVAKYDKRTKKNVLRSDVRAIRDSIAHGHFVIREIEYGYEIEFDNDEYPFHKVFTGIEFYKFFDLHTMLFKIQLGLLIIIELFPMLAFHFLKRPSAS